MSGITSAQAAHASIKTPLTRRGQQRNFVLATPQVQQGDLIGTQWARPIVAAGCGAIYMAASAASRIKGCLLALGLAPDTPVTWVADAGHRNAHYVAQTLQNLTAPDSRMSASFADANAPYILLIGTTPGTTPGATPNDLKQATDSSIFPHSSTRLSLATSSSASYSSKPLIASF